MAQEQEIVISKEPVQQVKDLFNLICESGEKYSTFQPNNYALNTPIVINFEEVASKTINKKTGQPFMQKRCSDPKQFTPRKPQDNKKWDELMGSLTEMQAQLTEIGLDVKDLKKVGEKSPF